MGRMYEALMLPRTMQDILTADKKLGLSHDQLIYGVGYPVAPADAPVSAHDANDTLDATDMGRNNTNTGASGTIVLTLPAAASFPGQVFRVQVTAAQIVRVDPASGEAIFLGGSGVVSKYCQIAGVIGNYADIWCDGVAWHVVGYSGVLTKES